MNGRLLVSTPLIAVLLLLGNGEAGAGRLGDFGRPEPSIITTLFPYTTLFRSRKSVV